MDPVVQIPKVSAVISEFEGFALHRFQTSLPDISHEVLLGCRAGELDSPCFAGINCSVEVIEVTCKVTGSL